MPGVKFLSVPASKVVGRGWRGLGKLPILSLIAILGVSVVGGLVLAGPFRLEPRITYIDGLSVDPDKTEFTFYDQAYLNETREYLYLIYPYQTNRYQVVLESLSEGLQVLDRRNPLDPKTVQSAPYILSEGKIPEEGCFWLGLTVIMPNQIGTYELDLSVRLSALFFSREYKWSYTFEVVHPPPEKPFENCLVMALDKETYYQGDNITVTIENILNESIGFIDCKIVFEKFDGVDWEFYDSVSIPLEKTYLEPGEIGQFTLALIDYMNHPFPAGQYRVGIIRYWGDEIDGIYVEFEVI
jgi:hypothetical protein